MYIWQLFGPIGQLCLSIVDYGERKNARQCDQALIVSGAQDS
jgi:hypothetical protein